MQVRLTNKLLLVTAESDEERSILTSWSERLSDHVFVMNRQDEQTIRLLDLGPREAACREPINVTSRSPDPAIQRISNFAHTPFELDGQEYASVEAFWQGLKFPEEDRRREIARLYGQAARNARSAAMASDTLLYDGRQVRVGTVDHWTLMERACWAKFSQNLEARQAILGTGERPLTHKVRHDSRNIPGVVMADIWMKIRLRLAKDLSFDGSVRG